MIGISFFPFFFFPFPFPFSSYFLLSPSFLGCGGRRLLLLRFWGDGGGPGLLLLVGANTIRDWTGALGVSPVRRERGVKRGVEGRMDVIGGYEDYTAGKGHGVPAQHALCEYSSAVLALTVLVLQYANGNLQYMCDSTSWDPVQSLDSRDNGHRCQRGKRVFNF
ncbi:hypothetical protein B9Z19DRAFT_393611 [Tuber borchii]|uniref:Uncharacterized protein n=1 Tax=Tuber borchii TaxID=42251 RepID=A0A2T6ZHB7_TUBBO|nr:hypothetical protein B9Z19DRAFT_393611 [Tuber borchii]